MKEKISVIIKEPNKAPYRKAIDNTLEALRSVVGGYIETVLFNNNLLMVCNEEGKLMGLDYNFSVPYDDIVGTVFFCAFNDEGDFEGYAATIEEIEEITGTI